MTNMRKQIKTLTKDATDYETDDEDISDIVNESISMDIKVEIDEMWLHCDFCVYKCKKEKTMTKHMRTTSNGILVARSSVPQTLETQTAHSHKPNETMDCGN